MKRSNQSFSLRTVPQNHINRTTISLPKMFTVFQRHKRSTSSPEIWPMLATSINTTKVSISERNFIWHKIVFFVSGSTSKEKG